jgi:hypothetical protein
MRRFICPLIAGALFASGVLWRPVAADAAGRPCFAQLHARCFAPAEVASAERSMDVPPVDPSRAVLRLTHLSLIQAVVERPAAPGAKANVIAYSYGATVALDRPLPAGSRALLVTEFVLPKPVPGAAVKSQPGTIPSVLATFPHRRLALLVAGRISPKTLRSIALRVLRG